MFLAVPVSFLIENYWLSNKRHSAAIQVVYVWQHDLRHSIKNVSIFYCFGFWFRTMIWALMSKKLKQTGQTIAVTVLLALCSKAKTLKAEEKSILFHKYLLPYKRINMPVMEYINKPTWTYTPAHTVTHCLAQKNMSNWVPVIDKCHFYTQTYFGPWRQSENQALMRLWQGLWQLLPVAHT